MSDLIERANAAIGGGALNSNLIGALRDEIERLTAELKATQDNEQRLVDANKPLLADKYRLQARVAELEAELERVRMNSVRPAHRRANSEVAK